MARTSSLQACALLLSALAAAGPAGAAEPAPEFALHGYIRTGLGFSEDGATQADFQAPGAPTRYRLGNEAHTNFEFALDYRYAPGADAPEGAYIQGYFMMDDIESFGDSAQLGLDHTAQAYIKFAGYLDPGVELWVGRRYYDRKFIGINRYHWLNPGQNGQAGAGVEGLRLGSGTLAAALFRSEDAGVQIGAANGTVNSTLLDLRYAGLPAFGKGVTTGWAALAQRARHEELGLAAKGGFGLGLWHDLPAFGGLNTTALLYRQGAALAQAPTNPNPVREDQGYDLDDAYSVELNNALLAEPGGGYGLQWAAALRHTDFGLSGSTVDWVSTGVRPVWYLGPHLHLMAEAGIDYVDDRVNDRVGQVNKLTLALQLAQSPRYFSTPALRLFITHANWSDAFRGLVGNAPGDAPYGDATSGWTLGAQAEAVW